MKQILSRIAWLALVPAFVAIDLQLRPRSGQVQRKLDKCGRCTNTMLATNNSPRHGMSAVAREVDNFFGVPNDMQKLTNRTNLRRFMFSDMYDTLESVVRGIAHRMHPTKRKLIPYEGHFKSRYRFIPMAPTNVKNVVKSPPAWIKAGTQLFFTQYPPVQLNWLSSSTTPTTDSTNNNYNHYKMLEELALLEWKEKQRSSSTLENSTNSSASDMTLNVLSAVATDSPENWSPIGASRTRVIAAEGHDPTLYGVTESSPEESRHTSGRNNITTSRSLSKNQDLHSHRETNPTENEQARTSNKSENKSYINGDRNVSKSKVFHKSSHFLGPSAYANPITFYSSSEMPPNSRRYRGALQYGDKL